MSFSVIWNIWGVAALLQLLEVGLMGERAIKSSAHQCRHMTVIFARITWAWIGLLLLIAWLR